MFQKYKSVLLCALFLQIIFLAQSQTANKVIIRQPSSTYGFIGTKATFDLQVTSEIEHRRLIWYLNDKVLAETVAQRVRIDVKEGMNNSKVHAEVYSGADLLEVSDPAYLYVVGKPSINVPQYDIHLTPGTSLRMVPEGASDIALPVFIGQTWAVNLTQYVTGEGLVWQWLQNGRAMTWSEDGLIYMAKGDLQMTVSREDINSIYQLNITNPAGTVFSNKIKLIKQMAPRFKKNLPKRATMYAGEEVEISVQFEDDGYTRFQWALNGTNLFRETSPSIKLIAQSALDGLNLTVTATNPSGETSQTITLRVLWPKWAIVVIVISIVITLAAALFALVHKGIIRKPACMDSSRVEYSLQHQLDHGDPEDDLELSIDLEDK